MEMQSRAQEREQAQAEAAARAALTDTKAKETAAAVPVPGSTLPLPLPPWPVFPVPALQTLLACHYDATRALELSVGGPDPLPLLYLLVAALVAAPRRQAVVVVDLERRFDVRALRGAVPWWGGFRPAGGGAVYGGPPPGGPTDLSPTEQDLQHVHVFRVDPRWQAPLADIVAAAEQRVLYGAHRRRDRACWGTLVVGSAGMGGGGSGSGATTAATTPRQRTTAAVTTGYYGWLRVNALESRHAQQQKRRQWLASLLAGSNADDTDDKDDTAAAVADLRAPEPITWVASSPWGSFPFRLHRDPDGREGNRVINAMDVVL